MSEFDSLLSAFEDWFDTPLHNLPEALRQRVEKDFSPMPWDEMSADQRRSVALQFDYQHDPATRQERRFWWDFFERKGELENQIAKWLSVDAPTASDLVSKETRLAALRQELASMEQQAKGGFCRETGEKQKGHLNHDPVLQQRANEIAAEKKKLSGRPLTRGKVAKLLADERGMNIETVERRIRKQWD